MSLGSPAQLDVVAGIARTLGRPAVVHLELDSGPEPRRRPGGGLAWTSWPPHALPSVDGTLTVRGVWTHLAWADVPGPPGQRRSGGGLRGSRPPGPGRPDWTRT